MDPFIYFGVIFVYKILEDSPAWVRARILSPIYSLGYTTHKKRESASVISLFREFAYVQT